MHILLIRFSSLGDIVLQTSFISWLKFIDPSIKVSFITSKGFESILEEHEDLDQVFAYERKKGLKDFINLRQFIQKIHTKENIDFIVDLHSTTRASYLRLMNPSIPCITVDKRRTERHFLVNLGLKMMNKTRSIHSRNIHDMLGLFSRDKNLIAYEQWLQDKYNNKNLKYSSPLYLKDLEKKDRIVIAPVASFKSKRWNILNYKEVILKILANEEYKDFDLVNLAGPDDSFCNELNDIKNDRFNNLQGKTSLKETIEIISSAKILVGNDSGLGHIAESFGVPVVAVFGPTDESLGFAPHLSNSKTLSHKMWCRPCSPTGKSRCYRRKQHCMEKTRAEDVLVALRESLQDV